MTEGMAPEQMDEWMAWNELHHGVVNGERLLNTVASSASAVCGSNGMDMEPWRVIPGAVDQTPGQTDQEQQANMAGIAARQNAGW